MASTIHNGCTPHNHADCIEAALSRARSLCKEQGVRLTPLREQVLRLIWQSHKPVGAYELLGQLRGAGQKPAAPPTVYRALEFLQTQGLVHQIASLNAFIGCHDPGLPHPGSFLICRQCQRVQELPEHTLEESIKQQPESAGFLLESIRTEVLGLCADCQRQELSDGPL